MKMDRRKALVTVAWSMSVLTLVIFSIPFFSYFQPSASAGATLPHIDISHLRDGAYLEISDYGYIKYLVLKDYSSNIHVYAVPMWSDRDHRVVLPDVSWWHFGGVCEKFGPDMQGELIRKGGAIRCQDFHQPPDLTASTLRWTYAGKDLSGYTDDMVVPKFKIENQYVIIGKM